MSALIEKRGILGYLLLLNLYRIFSLEKQRNTANYNNFMPNDKSKTVYVNKKKNSLPKVKLSTNKLNLYKYHKSYFRYSKFEKLNLLSKPCERSFN